MTTYKLVPVEPTPAMRKAAADAWLDCDSKLVLNKAAAALRAGIAAAPTQPEVQGDALEDAMGFASAAADDAARGFLFDGHLRALRAHLAPIVADAERWRVVESRGSQVFADFLASKFDTFPEFTDTARKQEKSNG